MSLLWQILVPTVFDDTKTPVRTKHHKNWDAYVVKLAGGLTIFKPGKGQWLSPSSELIPDRVIPVMIACDERTIMEIAKFTLRHYRQQAVFIYRVSDDARVVTREEAG